MLLKDLMQLWEMNYFIKYNNELYYTHNNDCRYFKRTDYDSNIFYDLSLKAIVRIFNGGTGFNIIEVE